MQNERSFVKENRVVTRRVISATQCTGSGCLDTLFAVQAASFISRF